MAAAFAWVAGATALGFAALSVLMLGTWRSSSLRFPLALAASLQALWLGLHAAPAALLPGALAIVEVIRDAGWFWLLLRLAPAHGLEARRWPAVLRGSFASVACVLLGILAGAWLAAPAPEFLRRLVAPGFLVLAVLALVLLEQVLRGADARARWRLGPLVLAVGTFSGYDFYFHAEAILIGHASPLLWQARPLCQAIALPLLLLGARRSLDAPAGLPVSRSVAFHASVLSAAGAYLLVMAGLGYYVQRLGGQWGGALRIAMLAGATVFLCVLLFSHSLQRGLRRFLALHFYPHQHDWQQAWWSFTGRLAHAEALRPALLRTVLDGMAGQLDCAGGSAWTAAPNGGFVPAFPPETARFPPDAPWLAACRADPAPLDLVRLAACSQHDAPAALPQSLLARADAWLLVPIAHGDRLLALVLLCGRRGARTPAAEDDLLLRTMARQAAAHLALLEATEALADARQFEAFNRLSAFLVHDLKNIAAQLSLVVHNAERHLDAPGFARDAMRTVADAEVRLARVLAAFREAPQTADRASLEAIAREAIARVAHRRPVPTLAVPPGLAAGALQSRRLVEVLEHLLQNAQDATPDDGHVALRLAQERDRAIVEILDDGRGMTAEFLDNHLFRPFQTTKGKAGMGIGVHQGLQVVKELGGQLVVESSPGAGSCFRLSLPAGIAEGPP